MRAAGHRFDVLSLAEEDTIHANMLRLVERVGLQVENDALLDRLVAIGGRIDRSQRRATFAPPVVEEFLAASFPPESLGVEPRINGNAGIYYGHYLDPYSDEFKPMTLESASAFVQVARAMPHVGTVHMLGCPLEGFSGRAEPLWERYWSWSMGIQPGGSIHRQSYCPAILDLCQVHAAATGRSLAEVCNLGVYLVPPLKLAHQEAAQVAWFLERGLRVDIGGSMPTGGATAPVTLAGIVTLAIAESLLLGLLSRALYGDRRWTIWTSCTALDARTMMRPYGRPDMALANLMGAQMARRYGCSFGGHCGLADAMRPSPQAATQKLQSALPTLLASGHVSIPAGLLGVDEVLSPVQLVLDDQMIAALGQFAREYEVSDEAIAADVVEAVGPGGHFVTEPHTAAWFRRELWEPALWERRHFTAWIEDDGNTDVERARARALEVLAAASSPSALGEEEERVLRQIIASAERGATPVDQCETAHSAQRSG